uniref:Reverse transcriptase/retrotransposon-derived protein RNase H-like domain-containing protein n=1 Tax=Bubo bubo TaxID=30461 RepID=A0A8C0FU15_BUBBB
TKNEEVEPIAWGPERGGAFEALKEALLKAPALGITDYNKPFKLYCTETKGIANGALTQTLGPHERPVAYYFCTLDSVIKGTPFCIRAIATSAELVERTRNTVLGHPLTVCVPYEVEIHLNNMQKRHFPLKGHTDMN